MSINGFFVLYFIVLQNMMSRSDQIMRPGAVSSTPNVVAGKEHTLTNLDISAIMFESAVKGKLTSMLTMIMMDISIIFIINTRGEGGLWPPSPLVRVAGATLISSEEIVSSEFVDLSV